MSVHAIDSPQRPIYGNRRLHTRICTGNGLYRIVSVTPGDFTEDNRARAKQSIMAALIKVGIELSMMTAFYVCSGSRNHLGLLG